MKLTLEVRTHAVAVLEVTEAELRVIARGLEHDLGAAAEETRYSLLQLCNRSLADMQPS